MAKLKTPVVINRCRELNARYHKSLLQRQIAVPWPEACAASERDGRWGYQIVPTPDGKQARVVWANTAGDIEAEWWYPEPMKATLALYILDHAGYKGELTGWSRRVTRGSDGVADDTPAAL